MNPIQDHRARTGRRTTGALGRAARRHLDAALALGLIAALILTTGLARAPETPLDFERFLNAYCAEPQAPFAPQCDALREHAERTVIALAATSALMRSPVLRRGTLQDDVVEHVEALWTQSPGEHCGLLCERMAVAVTQQIAAELHYASQATPALSLRAAYLDFFAPVSLAYAIGSDLIPGPTALALALFLAGVWTVREGRLPGLALLAVAVPWASVYAAGALGAATASTTAKLSADTLIISTVSSVVALGTALLIGQIVQLRLRYRRRNATPGRTLSSAGLTLALAVCLMPWCTHMAGWAGASLEHHRHAATAVAYRPSLEEVRHDVEWRQRWHARSQGHAATP